MWPADPAARSSAWLIHMDDLHSIIALTGSGGRRKDRRRQFSHDNAVGGLRWAGVGARDDPGANRPSVEGACVAGGEQRQQVGLCSGQK